MKCHKLPLANAFGGRCENQKLPDFLSSHSNGAAEVGYFQELRVNLHGSISNFPVWAHLGSIS